MYSYRRQPEGVSRKTRDILILVICVLVVLNALQLFNYQTTMSRSVALRETLVARVRQDIVSARSIAPQLSRSGGSNTRRWLSQTRQYLYGITQLNELTETIFGGGQKLVPQSAVDAAIAAVDSCEALEQEGVAFDTPMNELWKQLDTLQAAADALN